MMRGYWRNPEATREAFTDGWFRTGDVGYRDADGYLFLVDRIKDVIMRGGYSVYPREVEDALYEHPGRLRGGGRRSRPTTCSARRSWPSSCPRPGRTAIPRRSGRSCASAWPAYKYPRLVVVAAELPHGPSGKILKREIDRAPLRAALDAGAPAG